MAAPAQTAPSQPLPAGRILAYGQLGMPLAIADLPIAIYLLAFYSADVGIAVVVFSLVKMFSRFLDMVTDPLIGWLSDRTHFGFGRRKTWVFLGLPVTMLGIWQLFLPPEGADWVHLAIWLNVFYVGWTMITIPYGAIGAEMTPDYAERSRVTAARTMFLFAGILAASLAPFVTGGGVGTPEGLTPVMAGLGLAALLLFPVCIAILAVGVPEPAYTPPPKPVGIVHGLRIVFANGPFLRILASSFIGRIGASVNQAAVLWFFAFALGLGQLAALPLWIYLMFAVLGAPLWMKLGDVWTKHRALVAAVVFSVGMFAVLLAVPAGALLPAMAVMALAGLGGSASLTLGSSIAADVIDLDLLKGGDQRAGFLLAFWGLAQKGADALGIALAGFLIAALGWNPQTPLEGDPFTTLTIVYIVVPVGFFLVSAAFLWNFPLTPERQKRIRALIDRRTARRSQTGAADVASATPLPGD